MKNDDSSVAIFRWLRPMGIILWLATSIVLILWYFHHGETENESSTVHEVLSPMQSPMQASGPSRAISSRGMDSSGESTTRAASPMHNMPLQRRDTPKEIAAAHEFVRRQKVMQTFGEPLYSLQLDKMTFAAVSDLLYDKYRLDHPEPAELKSKKTAAEKALIKERKAEIERQLVATLGERGYDQLKIRVDVNAKQDEIRRTLATDMLDAGLPLEADQAEELAFSYVKAWRPETKKYVLDDVLTDAKSILTAEQFAVLQRYEQQRERLKQAKETAKKKNDKSSGR